MIPPDLASRLQANSDLALRPVAPIQEIADKLSGLTVGQRLMAEVQALLPNGTYRALINQRSVTLALPFSAKSGDTLELVVTGSDGRLALALASQRGANAGGESVSATLSRAGQLIGRLFSGADGAEGEGKALPLNGNRPVAETPPGGARDILPLLKEAIVKSGMFYESHQAEWIEGRFAKAELLREPQGKLSPSATETAANPPAAPPSHAPAGAPAEQAAQSAAQARAEPAPGQKTAGEASPRVGGQIAEIVAPQVRSLVHQQLTALADQAFVWQGQIWPGQEMRWEIEEDGRKDGEPDDAPPGWRTRLDLSFPGLGSVSAKLQLHGNQIALSLDVADEASLGILRADAETLRRQLEDAGLTLASLGIAQEPR
ncbi:MAG: flagellar hook-length control protein FliK [Candidatus Accumulibacter sp.]|jgi:hypothetical protein|nr:flagellar hook-length control protein FliK [Accumulibacter sp.]